VLAHDRIKGPSRSRLCYLYSSMSVYKIGLLGSQVVNATAVANTVLSQITIDVCNRIVTASRYVGNRD
jgi:hypothetical protein